jgi:hypothetical protein
LLLFMVFEFTLDGGVNVLEVLELLGGGRGGRERTVKEGRSGRVEAVVGVKGRVTGRGVGGVVVGGFGNGEVSCPVIMQRVYVRTKDLLNGAVCTLCLAVGLGVVGGGYVEFGAEVPE